MQEVARAVKDQVLERMGLYQMEHVQVYPAVDGSQWVNWTLCAADVIKANFDGSVGEDSSLAAAVIFKNADGCLLMVASFT